MTNPIGNACPGRPVQEFTVSGEGTTVEYLPHESAGEVMPAVMLERAHSGPMDERGGRFSTWRRVQGALHVCRQCGGLLWVGEGGGW
jgi:hypothetical protein